ncbi:MAG: cell division protein SepF [Acidimicrobiia bacterium]
MSLWRRAMVYLGLQDDEEFADYAHAHQYDDDEYGQYDQYAEETVRPTNARVGTPMPDASPAAAAAPADPRVSRGPALRDPVGVESAPSVRPLPREPATGESSAVRPIPASGSTAPGPTHVVEPDGFNDAQEVGDRLKGNQAVVLDLRNVSRELQRRLIDFSSGLAYGTGGSMSRVDDQVFLLAPAGVEVSQEEKDRLQARDYRA